MEVFLSSDVVMVGREKRRLLVLRWKAGTFAFNQVLYEAVVAAVALQGRPAGTFKELRFVVLWRLKRPSQDL